MGAFFLEPIVRSYRRLRLALHRWRAALLWLDSEIELATGQLQDPTDTFITDGNVASPLCWFGGRRRKREYSSATPGRAV